MKRCIGHKCSTLQNKYLKGKKNMSILMLMPRCRWWDFQMIPDGILKVIVIKNNLKIGLEWNFKIFPTVWFFYYCALQEALAKLNVIRSSRLTCCLIELHIHDIGQILTKSDKRRKLFSNKQNKQNIHK